MFLAHSSIADLVAQKKLFTKNYDKTFLKQCSYDLRLGEQVYLVGRDAPDRLSPDHPYISIPPGQFAMLTCYEEIEIPDDHMAFIALRSSFKFQGLVNISGFHVDPTHKGTLLFAVQNVGPSDIRLEYREPTFTIFFAEVKGRIVLSRSQDEQTRFKPGLRGIRLQDVQLLGGSSVTVAKLQKEIDQLRFIILVYTPVVVAVLGALIKLFWPTSPAPPGH
jgi:dCTP deaminase